MKNASKKRSVNTSVFYIYFIRIHSKLRFLKTTTSGFEALILRVGGRGSDSQANHSTDENGSTLKVNSGGYIFTTESPAWWNHGLFRPAAPLCLRSHKRNTDRLPTLLHIVFKVPSAGMGSDSDEVVPVQPSSNHLVSVFFSPPPPLPPPPKEAHIKLTPLASVSLLFRGLKGIPHSKVLRKCIVLCVIKTTARRDSCCVKRSRRFSEVPARNMWLQTVWGSFWCAHKNRLRQRSVPSALRNVWISHGGVTETSLYNNSAFLLSLVRFETHCS